MNLRTRLRARAFFSSTASSGRPFLQSKPSAASARRSSVLLAFRRDAPAVIIHTNTAVTAAKHQPVIRTAPSAKLPMAAAFSAIKLSCRMACRTAALGVNRPAAPRQETAVMPKITVNVMPTASNAQPALYRFLALARISSAGVVSALPNICRNQPGNIPAACALILSSFKPCFLFCAF